MQTLSQTLLECALLTEETNEKIADILGRSVSSIEEARKEFEPSRYGRLEKLQYITEIEDKTEKVYKMWTLSNGLKFIEWKLGLIPNIDPVASLQQLFTDTLMKSRESIFLSGDSDTAREAVKWTGLALQLGKLLKSWVVDGDQATLELKLALTGSILGDLPGLDDLT